MAKIIQEIEYRAKTQKAEAASKKLEKRMEEMFSRSALKAVAFNQPLMVGQKLLTGLVSQLKEGAAAALEYEQTNVKLRTILKATGHEVEQNAIALNRQAAAMEGLTGVSDEAIRTAQTMALTMGVGADKVDEFTRAGLALQQLVVARGGGQIPLVRAMSMLTEVQVRGTIPTQLEVIDAFQGLTKEQLKNLDVVGHLRKQYGDEFLGETLDTTTTKLDKLAAAWKNVWEAMFKVDAKSEVGGTLGLMEGALNRMASTLEGKGWRDFLAAWVGGGLGGVFGATITGVPGGPAGALTGKGVAAGLTPEQFTLTPTAAAPKGKGGAPPGGAGYAAEIAMAQSLAAQELALGRGGSILAEAMLEAQQQADEQAREDAIFMRDFFVQLEEDKAATLAAIKDSNAEVDVIRNAETLEKMQADQEAFAANLSRIMGVVSSIAVSAFDEMARGEEAVFENMAAKFLKSLGIMVLQKGAADMAMAIASTVLPPYTGAAGIGPAGAEIALGTLMAAGGAAIGGHVQGVRAAATQSGGAAGGFAGGSIGSGMGGGGMGGGDQIININISGIMTSAEAGREIQRQINDARRQGLI